MNELEHVRYLFDDCIRTHQRAVDALAPQLVRAGERLTRCLDRGGKVLSCGNGGSAADAQHFAAELVNRFESDRPGLAALALTTDSSVLTSIANDDRFERVYARQVQALAQAGDLLLAISTSGNSRNVEAAIEAAHAARATVVLLSGRDGGRSAERLAVDDVELRAPSDTTARIQEVHLLLLHCLCSLVDLWFQGRTET